MEVRPDGSGFFDPLFRGESVAVQTGLAFNPVEFDGIKTRVVEAFPDAEEFHRVAVSQPVTDKVIRAVRVFEARCR